jgi:hypothetical protein
LDKNRNRQTSLLTPGMLKDIQTAITRFPPKSLRKLSAQTGILLGSAPYCVEEDAEILLIPNAGFSRANSWRLC